MKFSLIVLGLAGLTFGEIITPEANILVVTSDKPDLLIATNSVQTTTQHHESVKNGTHTIQTKKLHPSFNHILTKNDKGLTEERLKKQEEQKAVGKLRTGSKLEGAKDANGLPRDWTHVKLGNHTGNFTRPSNLQQFGSHANLNHILELRKDGNHTFNVNPTLHFNHTIHTNHTMTNGLHPQKQWNHTLDGNRTHWENKANWENKIKDVNSTQWKHFEEKRKQWAEERKKQEEARGSKTEGQKNHPFIDGKTKQSELVKLVHQTAASEKAQN